MKYCVNDEIHEFFKNTPQTGIDLTYDDVLLKPRVTETKLAINFCHLQILQNRIHMI